MKLLRIPLILVLLVCCVQRSCAGGSRVSNSETTKLSAFFEKERVTIAFTDSGLGGLSIMAHAVRRMEESKTFGGVDFVFFNALFSNEGGYNSLESREEKVRIFSSALSALEERYSPDLIIIGCNTLSVLYDQTEFARSAGIPVVGIVEVGVDMIAAALRSNPGSKVVIFGTQTTVDEGVHEARLAEAGISADRIITQACPGLIEYIETGYESMETEMLISAYVEEAVQRAGGSGTPLVASLNCTHYGYSMELWKAGFSAAGAAPLAVLNPNEVLIDFLFPGRLLNRYPASEISVRAVSMVEIAKGKTESIGEYLEGISPRTAEALRRYERRDGLFEWE
jgi:glutamate racemase